MDYVYNSRGGTSLQ